MWFLSAAESGGSQIWSRQTARNIQIYGGMRLSDLLKRHIGKAILVFVAGYSLVYAIAFINLYSMEHPYRLASAWIYENVPSGSTIVAPHWDDKIPVTLPGPGNRVPQIYKMDGREFELPVYEQDNPPNIQLLLRRIAAADYISFATPRTPDSIPRIENEYPHTTAIIQLLWAEKLGFSFAKSVKNRPSFFGITFNDDLADESFSVYDHPKAVIFKNEEHLSPEELWSRVMRVDEYRPLPTMNEILLMDKGGWQPTAGLWKPEWSPMARSLAFLSLVGLSVWALVVRPGVPLSLIGGVVGLGGGVAALLAVAVSVVGLLPFSGAAGRFIALGLCTMALVRVSLQSDARSRMWASVREHALWLVITIVATLLVIRAVASSGLGLSFLGDPLSTNYLGYVTRSESLVLDSLPAESAVTAVAVALAWILKSAAVPFAMLYDVATLLVGFVLACVLYTISAMLIKSRAATALGAILASVPIAYLLLGVSTGVGGAPSERAQLAPERIAFTRWASTTIKGAPVVVESCDDATVQGIALQAGLPVASDVVLENGQRLCSVVDAELAFKAMMARGLHFFVTPALGKSSSPGSAERLTNFSAKKELFSKLYQDEHLVVFVPAFAKQYKLEG